jgi:hypothetical protein
MGLFRQGIRQRTLYKDVRNVRNRYLHSGPLINVRPDALRMIPAAYRLIVIFFGFPEDLFDLGVGIGCIKPFDPRFQEFYLQNYVHDDDFAPARRLSTSATAGMPEEPARRGNGQAERPRMATLPWSDAWACVTGVDSEYSGALLMAPLESPL